MAGIEGLVSNQGDPAAAKSLVDHGFISTPMGGELGLAPEQFADFGKIITKTPLSRLETPMGGPRRHRTSLLTGHGSQPGRNCTSMAA
jgi:hypothetical protein